jgi:hypothetical protein
LGIDRCGFSPRVQQKIVHAGVNGTSYQQASYDLVELSELNVSAKRVERLVKKIGQERIDQRDAAVAAHMRLPLMAKGVIADPRRPSPSVVMVGGSRSAPNRRGRSQRVTGGSRRSRSWKPTRARSIPPIPTPTCRAVFST